MKMVQCSIFISQPNRLLIKTIQLHGQDQISCYVNGERVHPVGIPRVVPTLELLKSIIYEFAKQKICTGIKGDESLISLARSFLSAEKAKGVIKATNCLGVAKQGDICRHCGKLQSYLRIRAKRCGPKRKGANVQSLKRKTRLLVNENKVRRGMPYCTTANVTLHICNLHFRKLSILPRNSRKKKKSLPLKLKENL